MHSIKPIKQTIYISDSTKGHKILAALYLVTDHLSDTDPLKNAIRTKSVELLDHVPMTRSVISEQITTLLNGAVLAHCISEKNASIIILEMEHFVARTTDTDTITHLFAPSHLDVSSHSIKKTKERTFLAPTRPLHFLDSHSNNTTVPKEADINDTKNKRQETILSFINDRKSAGIKDIAQLFPLVSEKTIQRELSTLVALGKITKRGDKRWSVYMTVQ